MNRKEIFKQLADRLFPGPGQQEHGKGRTLFSEKPDRLSKEDIESLRKWLDSLPEDEDE